VFEKTQYGDLDNFLRSEIGRMITFEDRLDLCADVAAAVLTMHSCRKGFKSFMYCGGLANPFIGVIYGYIKLENVLIFQDHSSRFVAKVADFGNSTLAARDDDLIEMPKSEPWNERRRNCGSLTCCHSSQQQSRW